MLLERKGWRYVNADLRPGRNGSAVCADAHRLPFRDGIFGLIVAKDALEHCPFSVQPLSIPNDFADLDDAAICNSSCSGGHS